MTKSCLLSQTLSSNLPWNRARIKFFSKLLLALIQVKTVNLVEIASVFQSNASSESSYRGIRRFFANFDLNYSTVALFVLRLLNLEKPYVLAIDRTNWKFGKKNINILVLGVVWNNFSFPLFWMLLPKRGNSKTHERIALLKEYLQTVGKENTAYLLADREFIGEEWFAFLLKEGIRFRIRIKWDSWFYNKKGKPCQVWQFFSNKNLYEPTFFKRSKTLWNQTVYLSGMRIKGGEYLLIVSSEFTEKAIEEYKKRWGIETLFGALKRRGFRMEETHLTAPERLKKLVVVLAIAVTWSFVIGEYVVQIKPLKLKKHGRKEKSIFHVGLEVLRNIILSDTPVFIKSKPITFQQLIAFLSCT